MVVKVKPVGNPKDILKDLHNLSQELQTKAVSSAVTAAAKPINRRMKELTPRRRGTLVQSINTTRVTKAGRKALGTKDGIALSLVGPNKKVNGRSYGKRATWLEAGTKAHGIEPKKKEALRMFGGAFADSVQVRGVEARWFMKKSLDGGTQQLKTEFYRGMERAIKRFERQAKT